MQITPNTKVYELLKEFPQLEEILLLYSPAFAALKNPVLRKTVAKVTSLQQAAKVAGVDMVEMVNKLRQEVKQPPLQNDCVEESGNDKNMSSAVVADKNITYRLDVRPIIGAGEHPKNIVLEEAEKLQPGQCLELITAFPPIPIIDLLHKRGFVTTSSTQEAGKISTFVEIDVKQHI